MRRGVAGGAQQLPAAAADTAAGGQDVLIDLQARRFFCGNGACAKTTFAEQVPPLAIQVADRWQCAMRRLVVSPAEPGGIRREVLGSDGLPGSER